MPSSYQALQQDCTRTLDRLWATAQKGMVAPAIRALMARTDNWRRTSPRFWRPLVSEVISTHPLAALANRCPMTNRARSKPCGYAGDPLVLDYIYESERFAEHELHGADRAIFRTVADSPSCASFEYRRHLIAERIDALAGHHRGRNQRPPNILNLAGGHARELDLLRTVPDQDLGRIVVCDQDSDCLAAVRERCSAWGDQLQTRALTARQFLAHAPEARALGHFDLVYCAGQYDHLEQRTATRLTKVLFDHVAPGGALLLTNFHPSNCGIGYMEAFMDWWLVYRDEAEMQALAADIEPVQIASRHVEMDPFGNVLYLTLKRQA